MKHSMSSYLKNKQKELGNSFSKDFEYHSGTNENFLNISQIEKLLNNIPYKIIIGSANS